MRKFVLNKGTFTNKQCITIDDFSRFVPPIRRYKCDILTGETIVQNFVHENTFFVDQIKKAQLLQMNKQNRTEVTSET